MFSTILILLSIIIWGKKARASNQRENDHVSSQAVHPDYTRHVSTKAEGRSTFKWGKSSPMDAPGVITAGAFFGLITNET